TSSAYSQWLSTEGVFLFQDKDVQFIGSALSTLVNMFNTTSQSQSLFSPSLYCPGGAKASYMNSVHSFYCTAMNTKAQLTINQVDPYSSKLLQAYPCNGCI